MKNNVKKKIITKLKNHKLSLNELSEECNIENEQMLKYIDELMDDHVDIDVTKRRKKNELLYHINVLPDIGNVYHISDADNIKRNMRFAGCADIHLASKYHLPKTTREALKRVEDDGIRRVYIAGDIVDGIDIYKGHRENTITDSVEEQTDMAAELFSEFPNLEFWGIAGNHDFSHTKKNGSKPLSIIEAKADNFKNLGDLRADIVYRGIKIRLLHGGSGRTYARSYPTQVYLRDLFGGSEKKDIREMPDMIIVGHYHTVYKSKDHGIWVVQPGSFQDGDNEFCIRRGLTGPNGMYEIDIDFQDGIINEFDSKYIQPRIAIKEKGSGFMKTVKNYR